MPFLVFQTFGVWEALVVLAIVVVLFGANRIGDIGGAMGRAIREFRREMKEPESEGKTEEATKTTEDKG
ncbi:MAG: twin-arginine translocase TatA/TatE family subunit [Chloroflexi bacterium]|nr:twin-arginine translocase TatA/TatE family subunit [Chloroflexota bacterium]